MKEIASVNGGLNGSGAYRGVANRGTGHLGSDHSGIAHSGAANQTTQSRPTGDPRLAFLRRIPLFTEFQDNDFLELERLAHQGAVTRGGFVYVPGDPSDQVYFLRSGRLKVARTAPGGKEWILHLVEPGEIFGELSLAGEDTRRNAAEALEDIVFCSIRREPFLALAGRRPTVGLRMLRLVGERRRLMEARVEGVLFAGVQERLLELLLDMGRRYGVAGPEGLALRVQLSQKEIAHLIGSTRETTSSTLNQLRRDGLIFIQRRRLVIRNLDRIEQILKGAPAPVAAPVAPSRRAPEAPLRSRYQMA
jgi:CRP/FNR family transcriptional regulator